MKNILIIILLNLIFHIISSDFLSPIPSGRKKFSLTLQDYDSEKDLSSNSNNTLVNQTNTTSIENRRTAGNLSTNDDSSNDKIESDPNTVPIVASNTPKIAY